ncbi:hypothetical protein AYO38_09490 [bacterium SCGC AG-212-C10]|nr:hypothetical protein AYO38_09490 [bacterium SCGC AG-212-C10]
MTGSGWKRLGTGAPTLYYTSKFTAQVAQNLLLASLFVAAGSSSDAAMGLSSLFVAMLVPALVFGVFGGAIVDRVGAGRGYVLGAMFRLISIGLAFTLAGGGMDAWMIAFIYSLGSQVFSPAEMALVRTVQSNAPGRAHSFMVALQYGGQGVGMLVLAPLLYLGGGLTLMIAGSFVCQFAVLCLTLGLLRQLRGTAATRMQRAADAFTFGETCRFFATDRRAAYAVVALAFKVIVARGIVVTLPFYLRHDMGLGQQAVAYLLVPGIIGVVIGLAWASRAVTVARSVEIMRLSLAGMVISVFALAVLDYGLTAMAQYSQVPPIASLEASMNTTFVVAVPVAFLLGLAFSGALISARVALTESAPIGQEARVFAVQGTLTDSLLVLPLLLTGLGTEFAGARMTLAAIGIIVAIALVALESPRVYRLVRRAFPATTEPAPAQGS